MTSPVCVSRASPSVRQSRHPTVVHPPPSPLNEFLIRRGRIRRSAELAGAQPAPGRGHPARHSSCLVWPCARVRKPSVSSCRAVGLALASADGRHLYSMLEQGKASPVGVPLMTSTARAPARRFSYGRFAGVAAVFVGMLLAALPGAGAPAAPAATTPEAVRELQARFKEERSAVASSGQKVFAPDWYERADALAKQAEEALALGRL